MRRPVRVLVVVVMVAAAALIAVAGPAGAKGKPAKYVLNCGDNVSSISLTVQMTTGLFGGPVGAPVPVSCVTSGVSSASPSHDVPGATNYNVSGSYLSSDGCPFGGGEFITNAARGSTQELVDCNLQVIGTLKVS